ncbi:MAG: hypothetical protein OEL87_01780 [Nanoarchaeota archaeon]|nr:hypothetical protein [Nanoarchaeota archaeon]
MDNRTFAEKYGLVGKGNPVRISQRTLDDVARLHRLNNIVIENGRYYARTENRHFGGIPSPGEAGSEIYFRRED